MLDQAIKETPYFADGKLLVGVLRQLVDDWFGVYENDWCDVSDVIMDSALEAFVTRFEAWSMHQAHAVTDAAWFRLRVDGTLTCSGMKRWLTVMLFAVTGYHRHVGTVADIAADPNFASFSNADGDAFGRPRQHMQMALIAGSTARIFPKVDSDFSFLAKGLAKEEQAKKVLQDFQSDMQA